MRAAVEVEVYWFTERREKRNWIFVPPIAAVKWALYIQVSTRGKQRENVF